jgi:maltose alpha-D-glucosyltransferase/alpha-amylase
LIGDLWYKNAILYSLDVETYLDANGDGIGDFEGLTRRLDYLEGLGVTAFWLTPFQPSPRRDDGYDISDFYGVDRRFGSGGDFVEFVREADSRGIPSSWTSSSTTPRTNIRGSRSATTGTCG